jgi:hypothetical protein
MEIHLYGEAIPPLRSVINIESNHKRASLQLGCTPTKMDRDDLVEHLKDTIQIIPDYGHTYLSMGICFAELSCSNELWMQFRML